MRKFSVRFAILCILALLVGATALAVSVSVSKPINKDANVVEVTLNPGTSGEDPTFSIIRKNADNGKLYTVLIRSGAEGDNPSGGDNGNLVYMDVVEAENGRVSVTKAYPKAMTPGTYRVYVSDYGKNAIAQAATFEVGNSSNETNNSDGKTLELGDVDGQHGIEPVDALMALQIAAHLIEWTDEQYTAADVDCSGDVEPVDAMLILQKSAHLIPAFPTNGGQS